jgi:GH43 family beta-xylosidase
MQRADPHVWKTPDGTYYFVATVPEYDRLEIRRSKTINGIKKAAPVVIWRKHETGPMGNHIWAPELHRIDGKWYIYFAAGSAERNGKSVNTLYQIVRKIPPKGSGKRKERLSANGTNLPLMPPPLSTRVNAT